MAFSMLLRNAAGRPQYYKELGALTSILSKRIDVNSCNKVACKATNTPIVNSVRQFQTTQVRNGLDHSKVWVAEKALSVVLLPLIPAALLFPSQPLDYALAIAVVSHTFWGFEAIAVDYARPVVLGPILPKVALACVYALCIATLGGLFYIINHDIGIANTIRKLWSVKPKQ